MSCFELTCTSTWRIINHASTGLAVAPRLKVYRRNAAARFELFVFEGANAPAELASIGWRGPVSCLLD
jgi:hypothetical protein